MAATRRASEPRRARRLFTVAAALAVLALGAGRTEASLEKLRKDMGDFAVKLKDWLKDQGEPGVVTMSSFQNLPELGTNPGPGLTLMLTQALKKADVPVKRAAPLGITGKLYRTPEDGPVANIQELQIALEVVGTGNKVVLRQELNVKDKETVAMITGQITGQDKVEEVVVKHGRFFQGPYGAEILVNGQPRPGTIVDGIPFVELKPDEEYTVRLINETKEEAAVWVGVDGLSMFAFSEDREPDGSWRDFKVLVPGQTKDGADGDLQVRGWYFNNGENGSRKFLITEYPQSAAWLKGASASQIGMITLQFWGVVPEGTQPAGVGTGLGAAFTQKWKRENRVLGDLQATITIRYDKN